MAYLGVLVLLLVSWSACADAQQSRVQSTDPYKRAYGNYNFYNANNIPYTIYNFCLNNLYNCQQTSYTDFCSTYDTTCNYQGTNQVATGNYYYLLINAYCPSWCRMCSGTHTNSCPPAPPTPAPTGTATKKCEYSKLTIRPKIFNGNTAAQCDNPWTVALTSGSGNPGVTSPFCQGVLLDNSTVVTTMECLIALTSQTGIPSGNSIIYATVGEYLPRVDEPADERVAATISSVEYLTGIVRLKLKTSVTKNLCVAPACLPSSDKTITVDKSTCKIVGWGITSNANVLQRPAAMKTANVIVAGDNECRSILSILNTLTTQGTSVNLYDARFTGCTSTNFLNNIREPSACLGDEGGAVTCEETTTREQILVGLVKSGGCDRLTTTFSPTRQNYYECLMK